MVESTQEVESGGLSADDLREAWHVLSTEERVEGFKLLPRDVAEEFLFTLGAADQADIILALPAVDRRSWMRLLPPDDAADVVQAAGEDREALLALLDDPTRKEVQALLAYAEDEAGGLMNPRYARVRPTVTVDEALLYLRKQAREKVETLYYAYVIDADLKLVGVVSFRDLFAAQPQKTVADIMTTDVITVTPDTGQEAVSRLFADHGLIAIPVVDEAGRMKGIVTVDDIVDVVEEEATEDIQKLGGTAALEQPYLQTPFLTMVWKRAGWLCALFLSEMLTSNAMTYFEAEIERAVVLAIFVPLVMSSGGNSGSQATSLIIRALALRELTLRDWWRVGLRELPSGLMLGAILGVIGVFRILLWQTLGWYDYGTHAVLVAVTVGLALVGVVTFGSMAGSLLPFLLRRLGFDPASASAPFVATLVDVSGLVIYFSIALLVLRGTLL